QLLFIDEDSCPYLDQPSFPTRRSSDLIGRFVWPRDIGGQRHMPQPLDALCECSARCAGKPQGSQTEVTASHDFRFERAIAKADADRKSTRLNSSHVSISYAVFCLKKKR